MRSVVVSDLHLGVRGGNDVARRPEVRDRLVETCRDADRLVLLGDVLELRERSLVDALRLARPLLETLSGALRRGGEIVLVPGNHDYALVPALAEPFGGPTQLRELEQRHLPSAPHPLARLAEELSPVSLVLAYPGVWLAPGVYATHGHYLDVHSSIPMVECLALAASARLQGGPRHGATPADYERIVGPIYRASRALGHAGETLGRAGPGDFSIRLYERLARRGRGGDPGASEPTGARSGGSPRAHDDPPPSLADLGDRVLGTAVPAAIAGLNRLGLGPFDPDLSGRALRRAGLRAMAEVVDRLGIEAEHVIFGHTHRAGPLPHDVDGWTVPARGSPPETHLLNTGNWVYEVAFLSERRPDSPYWPGRCAIVEPGAPPRLVHSLADAAPAELAS